MRRYLNAAQIRVRYFLILCKYPWLARGPRMGIGRGFRFNLVSGWMRRGRGTLFSDDVSIHVEGDLSIGENVYIGRNSLISCMASITIGNDVRIAERVSIHDENHVYEPIPVTPEYRSAYVTKPIIVGDGCWIGANVVILPGASIGRYTVIGAGSVVRGEIPSGVLVAGNPAKVVRPLRIHETSDEQ